MEIRPEKLNSEEEPGTKRDLTPEIIEKSGEKSPSGFALAAVEDIKTKGSIFYHETEAILRKNPDLPEEQIAQLKEVLEMARQIANSTKEEILKLAASQTLPPIKPGEIFIAEEEFKKTEHLSSEEKTKKMEEFNEKLSFQGLGLALCQEGLIKSIRQSPEVSFDELWKIVSNYSQKFGFDYGELKTGQGIGSKGWPIREGILGDIEDLIKDYLLIRELNASIKREYPDGAELFAKTFGRTSKGKIEIIFGPITICFRCYDADDYCLVAFGGRELTPAIKERLKGGLGCFIRRRLLVPLPDSDLPVSSGRPYLIAINNTGDIFMDEEKSKIVFPMIYFHEEQHAINYFIKSVIREKYYFAELRTVAEKFFEEFPNSKTDKDRLLLLEEYLRQDRKFQEGEKEAKNEILAFIKDGTPVDIIYEFLSKSAESEEVYDYFKFRKESIFEDLKEKLGEQYEPLIRASIKKAYEEEYSQLIKEGLNSFIKLTEAGFSKEAVIALFQKEPLDKWPKLVERLSKIKK